MKASGESSTTKHRLLHASGPHQIPPPNDPKGVGKRVKVKSLSCRVSMTVRPGFVIEINRWNESINRGRAAIPHSHLPAGIVATMRRVVNYHSSWARQQQVELFDASGNPGSTAGRGFNPAGGAPGGG
ncbi:hypothetical protein F511_17091 [Dorcoceras hygrometricum]|uniref:Uncharacterized protein n=1 Tax=Dorcoceras hygrometricum TaxID=472368 RepID=A0A2Z7BR81_9LAMI|nr:hypothetical protein F511_17091 [Dorcoceras hygrometricum]